jgi:hypothetical protein
VLGTAVRFIPRDPRKIAEKHEAEIRKYWTAEDIERARYLDESDPDVREALDEIREKARVLRIERERGLHAKDE